MNWKYPVLALAFVASIATANAIGYIKGEANGKATVQSQWDKEKYQALSHQHETLQLGLSDSYKVGLQYEESKHEVVFNTETIIKEVPVYIRDTSTCPKLPDGWSLLHNRAASIH